jgi:hypothetical protein
VQTSKSSTLLHAQCPDAHSSGVMQSHVQVSPRHTHVPSQQSKFVSHDSPGATQRSARQVQPTPGVPSVGQPHKVSSHTVVLSGQGTAQVQVLIPQAHVPEQHSSSPVQVSPSAPQTPVQVPAPQVSPSLQSRSVQQLTKRKFPCFFRSFWAARLATLIRR